MLQSGQLDPGLRFVLEIFMCGAAFRSGAAVATGLSCTSYSVVKLRWPGGHPWGMKMGGRRGCSTTRYAPDYVSNFERSVNHCRRHLTMRTAGFSTAPRILFTRQRASRRLSDRPNLPESPPSYRTQQGGLTLNLYEYYENKGFTNFNNLVTGGWTQRL